MFCFLACDLSETIVPEVVSEVNTAMKFDGMRRHARETKIRAAGFKFAKTISIFSSLMCKQRFLPLMLGYWRSVIC